MKLNKNQVAVFIENEQQLQEARELLERYMEDVFHVVFFDRTEPLMYDPFDDCWFMCDLDIFNRHESTHKSQITLPELEQILKEEDGSK